MQETSNKEKEETLYELYGKAAGMDGKTHVARS